MMKGSGQNAAKKSKEGRLAGGASPEHAKEKGGKQRRIHKSKDQLEQVHDVVEMGREVGSGDADGDSDNGGGASHPQQSGIARLRPQISLVDIVGPDGIERSDITRHPGHE